MALIIITFQDQGQKELEEAEIDKNQVRFIGSCLQSIQFFFPLEIMY